jgi:OsmC-like protein
MLLQALVACAGDTLNAVATALGLCVRDARISAEGDLDFRGTLGVAKEAPVGFRRLTFEIDADITPEQRASLLRLTERYCVVYQTLCTAAGDRSRALISNSAMAPLPSRAPYLVGTVFTAAVAGGTLSMVRTTLEVGRSATRPLTSPLRASSHLASVSSGVFARMCTTL